MALFRGSLDIKIAVRDTKELVIHIFMPFLVIVPCFYDFAVSNNLVADNIVHDIGKLGSIRNHLCTKIGCYVNVAGERFHFFQRLLHIGGIKK